MSWKVPTMTNTSLHEITATNWRATLSLRVRPEQQRFIADYTPLAAICSPRHVFVPEGCTGHRMQSSEKLCIGAASRESTIDTKFG
jgi:hypothetical protein